MDKVFELQKRLKKYNVNRFAVCLLAVLMLFSALSTGSMTVHAEAKDGNVVKMPVYKSETEYEEADIIMQQSPIEIGDNYFELIFRPYFGTSEMNELIAQKGDAAMVSIGIRLEWTDAEGNPQSEDLKYTEDMVKAVYTANSGKAFYIKATGTNSFEDLTVTPLVKSQVFTNIECLGTPEKADVAVESITLDKSALEIGVGDTATLTATVTPANATDKTVTWTSNDDTVATVDANGVVTGVKAGTATITATTSNSKTAECTVEVYTRILTDAFEGTTATGWNTGGATISTDGWLQLSSLKEGQNIWVNRAFDPCTGKVHVEFDYKIEYGQSTNANHNIIIVKGGEGNSTSLVYVKLNYNTTAGKEGWYFGVQDAARYSYIKPCEAGKKYHLELIVDRENSMYNLYVYDEAGNTITKQERSLVQADDVRLISMDLKSQDGNEISAYYDNINVYAYAE